MDILEYKITGKSKDKPCEDELVVTDRFIAVIDGVTSKSDFQYEGRTTGRLAADFVKAALTEAAPTAGLSEIISACGRTWRQFYSAVNFPYDRETMGPQAAAVVYSAFHREIWLIGDCQAMVDGRLYVTPKKSDEILAGFRSLVLHLTRDPANARELILPWIIRSAAFANVRDSVYGYAVINGTDIPAELIQTIQLDTGSHEIILASDGYPLLMPTLERSEQELARILENDPDCCRQYQSTKGVVLGNISFDDRTYIRFKI